MSTKSVFSTALFWIICFPLILGDLGRIRVSGPLFISITDIVVAGLLLWGLYTYIRNHRLHMNAYFKWVSVLALIFVGTVLIRITQVPMQQILPALLYPIRIFSYFLLPLVFIPMLGNKHHLGACIRVLILSGVIVSGIGIVQTILFPDLKILEYIGYDPHYARLVSTWLDPNFLGAALTGFILIALSQKKEQVFSSNREKFIVLTILVIALMLTFSRSAYIAAICGVGIYAFLTRSQKIAVGMLITIVLTAALYFVPRAQIDTARNIDRSFSANMRLKSYGEAITLFLERPIIGIGFNLVRYEKNVHGMILDTQNGGNSGAGVDSSWLLLLTTTGVVGFVSFLAFWIRLAYTVLKPEKQKQLFGWLRHIFTKHTKLQYAAFAFLVAWSINAHFINSLFYAHLLYLWQLIFSLSQVSLVDSKEKSS